MRRSKASFAATATERGTSSAYVSKRIAILEKALGVTLFHHAARRVTVTDDGERVYAAPALSLLVKRYPALAITLDAVDRRVDLNSQFVGKSTGSARVY